MTSLRHYPTYSEPPQIDGSQSEGQAARSGSLIDLHRAGQARGSRLLIPKEYSVEPEEVQVPDLPLARAVNGGK